ncbi:MAG: dihydrofolate reductase [Candidatus Peribacteraceae bacterium]|jgi:dihydrofolate reductase
MRVSLIAAASENNVIGIKNALPWDLPNDLQHFRRITEGKPVIMGWMTYRSIGRPLPNRENIVISDDPHAKLPGSTVVPSLAEAIAYAEGKLGAKEVFVIGGALTYKNALPLADRVYLTRVHAVIEGDAFFPELPSEDWQEVSREEHQSDPHHLHAYTFLTYERRT